MVVVVDGICPQLIDIEVRIIARYNRIQLLIAKHSEPFRFHDLEKTSPEETRLFVYLLVTLEISITHHELHLIFAE